MKCISILLLICALALTKVNAQENRDLTLQQKQGQLSFLAGQQQA